MNELSLQRGRSLKLTDKVYVKHHTLGEIEEQGYTEHYSKLLLLVTQSLDVADILWMENKVWYEDIQSEWEFFLQKTLFNSTEEDALIETVVNEKKHYERRKVVFISPTINDVLNYFLGLTGRYVLLEVVEGETHQLILVNVNLSTDNKYIITPECFRFTEHFYNITIEFLKQIHWLHFKYDVVRGGNRYAKEYILKQQYKKRNKPQRKETVNISTINSSLMAFGHNDVWDMPIYLFYELYYRHMKIKDYDSTMSALYSGCIDTKKNPIDYEKINWSSVIY